MAVILNRCKVLLNVPQNYDWIRNPFINIPANTGLHLYEEVMAAISSDGGLKKKKQTFDATHWYILDSNTKRLSHIT